MWLKTCYPKRANKDIRHGKKAYLFKKIMPKISGRAHRKRRGPRFEIIKDN